MFKKKVGHRQYRKKDDSESDNETQTAINPEEREVLQEALELRRYRKRPQGVTAQELLAGDVKSIAKPKEAPDDDPWKLKSGGLIDMTEMKTRGNFQMDSSAGGSGFAAASNVMDTEKKMQEFIEAELRKRKSEAGGPGGNGDHGEEKDVAPDDELFVIPDHLQVSSKPVSEGNVTLSAAMLTAIPEVDLGITSKLKNIEETEKAKRDMILMKNSKEPENAEEKITGPTTLTHTSYTRGKNRDEGHGKKRDRDARDNNHNNNNGSKKGRHFDRRNMATDDLVMDRFRKRSRK